MDISRRTMVAGALAAPLAGKSRRKVGDGPAGEQAYVVVVDGQGRHWRFCDYDYDAEEWIAREEDDWDVMEQPPQWLT